MDVVALVVVVVVVVIVAVVFDVICSIIVAWLAKCEGCTMCLQRDHSFRRVFLI